MTGTKEPNGRGAPAGATGAGQHRAAAPAEVALPPAPPGELPPEQVQKTRLVAQALERLGRETEPQVVAEYIKGLGLDIEPGEVATIRTELLKHAATPPGPDQPPPQEARRR